MRGSYSGNTSAFQADAESSILLPRSIFGSLAQLVERLPYTQNVGSSSLSRPTSIRSVEQPGSSHRLGR